VIAALYVEKNGVYANLEGVELWDLERDARKYAGPWPVVAHPPCARWCQLASVIEARYGHKIGDDEGCFEAALHQVRTFGGVLEHPAYSIAWGRYGLPRPERSGWTHDLFDPGASAHVEQFYYGHRARKATWLYAVAPVLPRLRWGRCAQYQPMARVQYAGRRDVPTAMTGWCRNRRAAEDIRPVLGKKEASASPPEFRDVLLSIARSAHGSPPQ